MKVKYHRAMGEFSEPSSCMSFSASSPSNGASSDNLWTSYNLGLYNNQNQGSLANLSSSLEQLLLTPYSDYCDAHIIVEGIKVGVHRCILAARSKFFHQLFLRDEKESSKNREYSINKLLPLGSIGYDAFRIILAYIYTGKLKTPPPEVCTCADNDCDHRYCRPAITFTVELTYAAFIFKLPEVVPIFENILVRYLGSSIVEDVFPILIVAHHCQLKTLAEQCIARILRSGVDKISIEKGLPEELAEKIKSLGAGFFDEDEAVEKRIKRIHKALDSDDVELVKLLLSECRMSLNEAYALHYAVAYCDAKVVSEVLALNQYDLNLKNLRGYTVLHVAAMRREPSIILSLLEKGACHLELTNDDLNAESICRRITRAKECILNPKEGEEVNNYRLCIEVLECQKKTSKSNFDNPDLSCYDLRMMLLHYENRVAFARVFYPTQARLAMGLAHADKTVLPELSNGGKADLNETPVVRNDRYRARLRALMKTVENGRRYFANCAEVIDKVMEDEDLVYLTKGTPDQQSKKMSRFREIKREVRMAFVKDIAAHDDHSLLLSPSIKLRRTFS